MTRQTRTLLLLGGVLVTAIAAVVFLVASSSDDAAAPQDAAPVTSADPAKPAATTASRPKRVGTAALFGEIRRTAGKAPVPDQEVVLAPERGDPWRTTTDAQGAFRFDKVPHGGPYELSAAAKGCGTIRLPGIALDRNEQRDVGTLFLDPSVRLMVRVRSHVDGPIEGALVEAFAIPKVLDWDWSKAMAQMGQAPVSVAHATTDAKGEALFPEATVGGWTFTAKKEGFAPGGVRNVSLRTGVEPQPATIYLSPGHPLDGRVLGPDKKPVAGALVMGGLPNSGWDFGSAPLRARATSDAEGKYAFAALESGETQLWVARAGAAPGPAATVRVPLVPHFDIVLKGTGVLAGTVTEQESGKPVEGASVRTTSWEGGGSRAAEAITDAEGKYSVETTAGTINRIAVSKDGYVQVPDPSTQGRQRAAVLHEGETVSKDFSLRHGARLTGLVTGEGAPVVGARVTVYWGTPSEGTQQKTVTTGADGRYEFPAIDKGFLLVLATKEGWFLPGAPDNWWQAATAPDEAKELKVEVSETGEAKRDIDLKRGSAVDGVVLGPDGAPLAGARVSGPSAPEPAATGADGAFHLVGVKPGPTVRLGCSKDGYAAATNPTIVVVEGQPAPGVTLRMVKQPHVRGTVKSASGGAVTEARVLLAMKKEGPSNQWEENSRWQNPARAPVKPDGTYDAPLTFSPPGKLLVRVVSLDRAQTDAKPVDMVEGQEVYDIDVVLADGADLAGQVVAKGSAAGIAGAVVSVAPHRTNDTGSYYGSDGQYPVWAVTGPDGRFAVPHMAAGQFDVRAQAEGFVADQTSAEAGKSLSIELAPELTIEGVVAFADGRPAEGIEVQPQVTRQPRAFNGMYEQPRSAVTDAKGAFRLQGLGEGAYSLAVRVPWQGGDVNIRNKTVTGVAAGAKDVKIAVESGGTISGRVVDAKRRGVTAWINASPMPKEGVGQDGNDWHNAQTKPDGAFTLTGLGEGPYHVNVNSQSGSGGGFKPVQLDKIAVGTKDLEVVLEEGLAISGSVVDADGKPLVQIPIQAQPVDQSQGQGSNVWTDTEGKFKLQGLAPGSYRIDSPNWGGQNQGWLIETAAPVVAGATDVRLVATKGITISGVVVDEAGKPVESAWLNAIGKISRQGQSKGDGTFEIAGVTAGQVYTIHAQATGRVNAQVADVAAGARDVRIVLAKGLEATGRLLDASGKPMANMWMGLTHSDGKHSQNAQTDADGKFTAGGLVDGTYAVTVYVQKADGGYDSKSCGSIKPGDAGVELRIQ